jgi:glycosyltransferase involved in cell wall biosynthesis
MLNPSTVDNMPNSVLEAYASGVPVVSTNVGGIPFIVRDAETALLTSPRDPQTIAEKLEAVLADKQLAQRLVRNGLQEAQRYTWAQIGEQWMRLYEHCATAEADS